MNPQTPQPQPTPVPPSPVVKPPDASVSAPEPVPSPTDNFSGSVGHISNPKKTKKIAYIGGAVVLGLILLGGGYFYLQSSKKPAQVSQTKATVSTTTTPTSTTSTSPNPTPATPVATTPTSELQTIMIKDFVASWGTDQAKAQAYLNLDAIKKDPACNNTCTDTQIIDSQKLVYGNATTVIDSYQSTATDTIKVSMHGSTNAGAIKGSFEYSLEAYKTSWRIVKIKYTIDKA